jgi:hypothetical protein
MAGHQRNISLAESDSPLIHDAQECDATSTLQPLSTHDKHDPGSRTLAKIHWLAPATMVFSYLLGIALAVGHHQYYTMLDGDVIGSTERQQWPLRYVLRSAYLDLVLTHKVW